MYVDYLARAACHNDGRWNSTSTAPPADSQATIAMPEHLLRSSYLTTPQRVKSSAPCYYWQQPDGHACQRCSRHRGFEGQTRWRFPMGLKMP